MRHDQPDRLTITLQNGFLTSRSQPPGRERIALGNVDTGVAFNDFGSSGDPVSLSVDLGIGFSPIFFSDLSHFWEQA